MVEKVKIEMENKDGIIDFAKASGWKWLRNKDYPSGKSQQSWITRNGWVLTFDFDKDGNLIRF